jgi:hypothetical protein
MAAARTRWPPAAPRLPADARRGGICIDVDGGGGAETQLEPCDPASETMMRRIAFILGRHAARVLHPVSPVQARAMLAELEYAEGNDSLAWAFGCLMASYRQRASPLAVGILAAQLCVALVAGAFGFLHAYVSFENLRAKILLIAGNEPTPAPASFMHTIDAYPLEHWLWIFLVFTVGGMLHVVAALMMAIGSNGRVLQLAIVIVGFDLVAPLVASTHTVPAIYQAIYIGLITLMAIVAAAFAWLWRWDERRLAATAFTTGL